MSENLHIFGIRHHGPGSARSLVGALNSVRPDIILVEGPADAQDMLALAGSTEMVPPVALLVYCSDDPGKAGFFPFTQYSPEWQAIQYGFRNGVPIRFMDLPYSHHYAEDKTPPNAESEEMISEDLVLEKHFDPIGHLAYAAGCPDSELWWENMVEIRRQNDSDLFQAILEAMTALRENVDDYARNTLLEQRREAYMRKTLRGVQKEGYNNIAIVCGAWHAPAFVNMPSVKSDNDLLKGLARINTSAAWVPWSYNRMSYTTGYGAGVSSPEWYHLLWEGKADLVTSWMVRAARLMREKQLDISSAHAIEAVRLAESLAAMRGYSHPGLAELEEAVLTVMCFGEETPMRLIREEMIIGHRMGQIPHDAPMVPLQQDLMKLQKKLRLVMTADSKDYDLDLRNENDLERSHLLHRLLLLEIPWARRSYDQGKKAGTFHEYWHLQWRPEFAIDLIQAARWGNTVETAASAKCVHVAENAITIKEIALLLDNVLLADLPKAAESLVAVLQERTALSGDVQQMMEALVPLARIMRYGNVRQTDKGMLTDVVSGLASRIIINLPGACCNIDQEAAEQMFVLIDSTHAAIILLQNEELVSGWVAVLKKICHLHNGNNLISGRCSRLLYDKEALSSDDTASEMSLALSRAVDPTLAGAWLDGFLRGSGLLLLHDNKLWNLIDQWVCELNSEHFIEILPLLRRTFSTYEMPERRQIGQHVKKTGSSVCSQVESVSGFDLENARLVLPLLSKILREEVEL